jgi:hypothetical protein
LEQKFCDFKCYRQVTTGAFLIRRTKNASTASTEVPLFEPLFCGDKEQHSFSGQSEMKASIFDQERLSKSFLSAVNPGSESGCLMFQKTS